LDEDRLKPVIRMVEPSGMAKRAMLRETPAADQRGITLELELSPDLPNCATDVNRVEQILINLLGNAIKYTPERSVVRVSITSRDGRVAYDVEDEGPGVAPSEVERIFDIYVSRGEGESRGIGLGLPLSRRLARLLGGELRAVSTPGKGGHFVLEIPAIPS